MICWQRAGKRSDEHGHNNSTGLRPAVTTVVHAGGTAAATNEQKDNKHGTNILADMRRVNVDGYGTPRWFRPVYTQRIMWGISVSCEGRMPYIVRAIKHQGVLTAMVE